MRSILDYLGSKRIAAEVSDLTPGNQFYSLLMATFRFADTDNMEKLKSVFPDIYDELVQRYNAPGGALDDKELKIALNFFNE
jgi:hypothetical protein